MPLQVTSPKDLAPGDYYEDCCYHPCLCTEITATADDIQISGISLVDGSNPRGCGVPGCDVRKLTFEEALRWKFYGPADHELAEKDRWWLPALQTYAPSWLQPISPSRPGAKRT
jgi:hypothetical protein